MDSSPDPILRGDADDYSYRVAADADPRFWFRLEREGDRDVITDFFLGSFPREQAGALLSACYRALELAPRRVLVFKDILPSPGSGDVAAALGEARDLYASSGKALLADFGSRRVDERLVEDL